MNFFNWLKQEKQEPLSEGTKETYNKVLGELKENMYPDMNIFYNQYDEFNTVLEQYSSIFYEDFNIYQLILKIVLVDLLEDYYPRTPIQIEKSEEYNNLMKDFSTKFWMFKYNNVMLDLHDSVLTFSKF